MKITKYAHACFTVELDEKLLIVDPGNYTNDIDSPENVIAIVITHEHADHFDTSAINSIVAYNPSATVVSLSSITSQLDSTINRKDVSPNDTVTIGPFTLEFFGGDHAIIHKSIPQIHNIGVIINDAVCYPGDSFETPNKPVTVLALPISAPWMKLAEAIDYVIAVAPKVVFPTHDILLSKIGSNMIDQAIPDRVKQAGVEIEYRRLDENPLTIE